MRIAITIWGERISPVFDSASNLMVANIENESVNEKYFMTFNPEPANKFAETLVELNVKALFCGAISKRPALIIESYAIEIIPFVTGSVNELVRTIAKSKPVVPLFLMPGCQGSYGVGCKRKREKNKSHCDDEKCCRGFKGIKGKFIK